MKRKTTTRKLKSIYKKAEDAEEIFRICLKKPKVKAKKQVTLVDYQGSNDPRLKDTLQRITFTMPTDLAVKMRMHTAFRGTYHSLSDFLTTLIAKEIE